MSAASSNRGVCVYCLCYITKAKGCVVIVTLLSNMQTRRKPPTRSKTTNEQQTHTGTPAEPQDEKRTRTTATKRTKTSAQTKTRHKILTKPRKKTKNNKKAPHPASLGTGRPQEQKPLTAHSSQSKEGLTERTTFST